MTFPLEIADEDLGRIQEHFDRRCALIGDGSSEVLWQDRIFGMVLGAAKFAGWGKVKKAKKGQS